MKSKNLNTRQIMDDLRLSSEEFNNYVWYSVKDAEAWVYSNYPCSKYVAKSVAYELYILGKIQERYQNR